MKTKHLDAISNKVKGKNINYFDRKQLFATFALQKLKE